MRRLLVLLLALICTSCVSVKIPRYIENESSYKRKFYASFDETLEAAQTTLADEGWTVVETKDPRIYEQNSNYDSTTGKQLVLFTETRQTSLILFSRYSNLNAFIRSLDKSSTEVEIRYYSATLLLIHTFKSTKNDRFVDHLLDQIAQSLENNTNNQ